MKHHLLYETPPLYGFSCFLLFTRIPRVFKADWLYNGHALLFNFYFYFFYLFIFFTLLMFINERINTLNDFKLLT